MEPDVQAFYDAFAQEHGEEAGTYLEFLRAVEKMIRAEIDAGGKVASAKTWLNTFDAEREVKMAKEMLENSSALLMTYELVVMIWPESKKAKRIYTANDIPSYDREETIEKSMIKFCENQVDPVDQERYMRFLDFRTMAKRIESTSKKYIQSLFRMRLEKEQSKWYTARVTQIQSKSETIFMLTVQSIQGTLNHNIDVMAEEPPDFL